MIKMVEYDGHYVPEQCCTMTNPITSGGESLADDCDMPCGDCCGDCDTCVTQMLFDEYAKVTNQIKEPKVYKSDYVPIGTKINIKDDNSVTTITNVTEFEEDTFGYGNYGFHTSDGRYLYRKEFYII